MDSDKNVHLRDCCLCMDYFCNFEVLEKMRLIDADALKTKKVYSEERHEKVVPVAEIDSMPTVDAVPVVRCEHCQYSKEWHIGRWCKVFRDSVSADWYCSLGEARGAREDDRKYDATN